MSSLRRSGRTRALARSAAAVSALLLLSGCGKNESDGLRAELTAARERWGVAGPPAYAVTQRLTCFCPPPREWTVVVIGGVPSFIESVEGGTRTSSQRVLEQQALTAATSVEGLFDWIDRHIDSAARLDVTFDPVLGFPVTVSADPIAGAADDEIAWELSDVREIGPCTEIGCSDALLITLSPTGGRVEAGDYVVTGTPAAGSSSACSFTVTVGGSCSTAFCVQGGDCASPLTGPDRILVTLPVLDGPVDVTVTIDAAVVATETVDPAYVRSQPNGPLCPPVCWSAQHEIVLP